MVWALLLQYFYHCSGNLQSYFYQQSYVTYHSILFILTWIQVSGSLYGALLGSILVYPITDFLGISFTYLLYPEVWSFFMNLSYPILWTCSQREAARTNHSSHAICSWWTDHCKCSGPRSPFSWTAALWPGYWFGGLLWNFPSALCTLVDIISYNYSYASHLTSEGVW